MLKFKLGCYIAEAQGLPRAAEPASPRGLAGPSGRGLRRGAPTLCALSAVPAKVSSVESSTLRPQKGRLGAETSARQQGTQQALTTVGRPIYHR